MKNSFLMFSGVIGREHCLKLVNPFLLVPILYLFKHQGIYKMGKSARNGLIRIKDQHCFVVDINRLNARVTHLETSQLICCANQSTGFYTRATLEFNGLITQILLILARGNRYLAPTLY